jgi:uncharacterized protein (DUF58 family)
MSVAASPPTKPNPTVTSPAPSLSKGAPRKPWTLWSSEEKPVLDHRITIEGILFILFTFAIGFAAYNTGNALLYLILSMMLSFLGFSGFMAIQTMAKLDAKRTVPSRLFAKTSASIRLDVSNKKRFLTSYSLRIRDEISQDHRQGLAYLLILPAKEVRSTMYDAIFPNRGIHRLGICHIFTRYPFGFFERHLSLPMRQEVLVYPRLRKFQRSPLGALFQLGEATSTIRGEGVDLHALRQHTPGDPARKIHWKASARSDQLIVKETETEAHEKFYFILNNATPNPNDPLVQKQFEEAVEFLASLGYFLTQQKIGMKLITRSGSVTLHTSDRDLERLWRALATIQLFPQKEAPPLGDRQMQPQRTAQIGFASEERKFADRYFAYQEWAALMKPDEGDHPDDEESSQAL